MEHPTDTSRQRENATACDEQVRVADVEARGSIDDPNTGYCPDCEHGNVPRYDPEQKGGNSRENGDALVLKRETADPDRIHRDTEEDA
jgi:hypothetical protein